MEAHKIDLKAYLSRIGIETPGSTSPEALEQVHLAHATSIPFENLDILLGRPILLELPNLEVKLIENRRGGYCFEQNSLFQAALLQLGYEVTPLAARVRLRSNKIAPRSHMLGRVDLNGESWIVDVGFGGMGLMKPILLRDGAQAEQFGFHYRLKRESADVWVLQSREAGAWGDLYAFTLEPQHPIDFAVSNWYVSTYPESIFVKTITAQRMTPDARYAIRNRDYVIRTANEETVRTIRDQDELLALLEEVFHLKFPAGTRFQTTAFDPV